MNYFHNQILGGDYWEYHQKAYITEGGKIVCSFINCAEVGDYDKSHTLYTEIIEV